MSAVPPISEGPSFRPQKPIQENHGVHATMVGSVVRVLNNETIPIPVPIRSRNLISNPKQDKFSLNIKEIKEIVSSLTSLEKLSRGFEQLLKNLEHKEELIFNFLRSH